MGARHIRLCPGLVDEHQPAGRDQSLIAPPEQPLTGNVSAILLASCGELVLDERGPPDHRDGAPLELEGLPIRHRLVESETEQLRELPVGAYDAIFDIARRGFGNRGYRVVQLEAGILSGKLYLGAYAQRLSATGLTFYDDDVTQFFSPHAQGKSTIMLVAIGKNAKM